MKIAHRPFVSPPNLKMQNFSKNISAVKRTYFCGLSFIYRDLDTAKIWEMTSFSSSSSKKIAPLVHVGAGLEEICISVQTRTAEIRNAKIYCCPVGHIFRASFFAVSCVPFSTFYLILDTWPTNHRRRERERGKDHLDRELTRTSQLDSLEKNPLV